VPAAGLQPAASCRSTAALVRVGRGALTLQHPLPMRPTVHPAGQGCSHSHSAQRCAPSGHAPHERGSSRAARVNAPHSRSAHSALPHPPRLQQPRQWCAGAGVIQAGRALRRTISTGDAARTGPCSGLVPGASAGPPRRPASCSCAAAELKSEAACRLPGNGSHRCQVLCPTPPHPHPQSREAAQPQTLAGPALPYEKAQRCMLSGRASPGRPCTVATPPAPPQPSQPQLWQRPSPARTGSVQRQCTRTAASW
jgi:hypothetical protein